MVLLAIYKIYPGWATDRLITEGTNIASHITPGYSALFDKGFNRHDLILQYKVTAKIPPFITGKRYVTSSEVAAGELIARRRIYKEHVTDRLKEFRLPDYTLPLNLVDHVDEI